MPRRSGIIATVAVRVTPTVCFEYVDVGFMLLFVMRGTGNPMRPHRARMVYSLVNSYGLGKQMSVYRPEPRSFDQLTEFHADGRRIGPGCSQISSMLVERVMMSDHCLNDLGDFTDTRSCRVAEYINFLKTVTPLNVEEFMAQLRRFNIGLMGEADCPVFEGLYQYCQVSKGICRHCHHTMGGSSFLVLYYPSIWLFRGRFVRGGEVIKGSMGRDGPRCVTLTDAVVLRGIRRRGRCAGHGEG